MTDDDLVPLCDQPHQRRTGLSDFFPLFQGVASQRIASLSPAVRAEAYDVSHFPELKDQYGAMSVPCIVITHADGTQQVEFGKKSIPQMLELVGA